MNSITATIAREWLARILSGKKRFEYRDASDFWLAKMTRVGPPPFSLRLINGMMKDAPEATVLVSEVHWDDAATALRFTIDRILAVKYWKDGWTRLHSEGWTDTEEFQPLPAKKSSPLLSLSVAPTLFRLADSGKPCVVEIETDGEEWNLIEERAEVPFALRLRAHGRAVDVVVQNVLTPFFGGPTQLVVSGRVDSAVSRPKVR